MRQCSVFAAGGVSTAICAGLIAACGGTGSSKPPLREQWSSDAGEEDDGPDDTAAPPRPTSFLRFADWTPDAVMGFDVCLAAHGNGDGGTWVGPLLGSALAFPHVSTYLAVPADTYDVSVVLPGGSCVASLVPVGKTPALAEGSKTTVALVGDLQPIENDPQASIVTFADDLKAPDGQAAVRFIDAVAGAPVVFGTGTLIMAAFSPLTGNVRFGTASTSPASGHTVDANGYVLLAPLAGATLSAHVGGTESDASTGTVMNLFDGGLGGTGDPTAFGTESDLATGSGATWLAGSVITVILVPGDFGVTPQLMLCQDTVGAAGGLTACGVLSQ